MTISAESPPMVKNINIKDFRRFQNFTGVDEEFCKFNLMYGWNYSGKTTLSNIFANFDGKNGKEAEGEYYLIKREDGTKLHQTDSDKLRVHVFNSNYVRENLFFESKGNDPNSTSNVILVTEGAVEKKQKIEKLKKQRDEITKQISNFSRQETEQDTIYRGLRTDYGAKIRINTNIHSFNAGNLDSVESEVDKSNLEQYIKQQQEIEDFSKAIKNESSYEQHSKIFANLYTKLDDLDTLLDKTISPSSVLEYLQSKDADDWVKKGLEIHRKTESKCLFCGGNITSDLFTRLDAIFSSEFDRFEKELKDLIEKYTTFDKSIPAPAHIADNYRTEYTLLHGQFEKIKTSFNNRIIAIKQILEGKIKYRNIVMKTTIHIDSKPLEEVIEKINELIEKHNEYTSNKDSENERMEWDIKKHYVATMLQDKAYIASIASKQETKEKHGQAREELKEIVTQISKKEAEISDAHKGIKAINENLSLLFIGQPTVELKPEKEEIDGKKQIKTVVCRGEQKAKHLSEGEKTSIAFAHFLASLSDSITSQNCLNEILFIDDPISSLDHNHIYSVSILIKELRYKFNQTFITTHNFELYKLLSKACSTKKSVKDSNNNPLGYPRDRFYCIKRDGDTSIISKIPKSLVEFKTEYNYLFHLLNEFKSNPKEDQLFMIGHCARRFTEIYLHNKYPSAQKLDQKLNRFANDNGRNATELSILYTVINEDSHTHTEKDFDKSYMKSVIDLIFDLLEKHDEKHFECLESSCC